MSRRGWILWSCTAALLLFIAINEEYRSLQQPVWVGEQQAEKAAMEQAGLSEVSSATKYVWDEPLWIVRGNDAGGRSVYAWLLPDRSPVVKDEASSASAASISSALIQRWPGASIVKIRAGWMDGKPAWEAFYSRQADQKRYYYDFYDFQSGTYITTYSLTAKKAS